MARQHALYFTTYQFLLKPGSWKQRSHILDEEGRDGVLTRIVQEAGVA